MQENEEKNIKIVAGSKKSRTFATAIEKQRLQRKRVPWMSGLVSGLQNRVRRFESARNLLVIENYFSRFYFGSLDEWLSQWSAKPCTAVRIRQEPQKILLASFC